MLFDLRGKRKRVVQVIYVGLALLMGVGLVGLGIGGGANGGLFDALGIGGNSTQASNPDYQSQIDKSNEALSSNPEDEKALLTLARYEFLSAQDAREVDEQGQITFTSDSIDRYNAAIDAWQRYLETKPKAPDDDIAGLMVQAYQIVAGTDESLIEQQLDQLVEAGQIVAEARPSAGTYSQLAAFAYYAGEEKLAADAKKKALAEAPDETTATQIKAQLAQAQKQGVAIAQQIKASAPTKDQLQDPTAGLGGSTSPLLPPATGTGAPGTAPTAP